MTKRFRLHAKGSPGGHNKVSNFTGFKLTKTYLPTGEIPGSASRVDVQAAMGDRDITFILDEVLAHLTRPHLIDEAVKLELRQCLNQLGVTCDEFTPRADLIAQIWAKKRGLTLVA